MWLKHFLGHFRMVVHAEDVVQFQSTLQPEHHIAIRGNTISGDVCTEPSCGAVSLRNHPFS